MSGTVLADVEIRAIRIQGSWKVQFVGIPLPADVQQAQKAITDTYRAARHQIAQNYHQSKQRLKQQLVEIKIQSRDLRDREIALQLKEQELKDATRRQKVDVGSEQCSGDKSRGSELGTSEQSDQGIELSSGTGSGIDEGPTVPGFSEAQTSGEGSSDSGEESELDRLRAKYSDPHKSAG